MRATIFNASAGSGKTYQLAYKYIKDVIEEPILYRHILAVTFTNKATEEMKSRILKEVDLLATGAKSNYLENLCKELKLPAAKVMERAKQVRNYILHDYSKFTVLTIDRFFQRILRAFIQELSLDLNYNIEIDSATIIEKSADMLIEQITIDKELREWLLDFVEERIEDGKRWDIRDGILSLKSEVFNETNSEALKMAESKQQLKKIIDKASAQCRETQRQICDIATQATVYIASAGCSVDDFKSKSRGFATIFYNYASQNIKEPTATARKCAVDDTAWCTKGSSAIALVPKLQPMLQQMIELYDQNITLWNTTKSLKDNYRSFALLSDLYNTAQKIYSEQNTMLLSQTKLILEKFIEDNDAPFIYEKVGNRFDRFMIDEFQDTSIKEWRNFLPLLTNAMSQSTKSSVMIVGDIKQSIYRWRGGDWRILHSEAAKELGASDTEVVTLKENFRSAPQVVEFNNALMEQVVKLDNTALNGMLEQAHESNMIKPELLSELRNMLQDAYVNHSQIARKESPRGYVEVTLFKEKPPIIERIKELLDLGYRPCDIMVLTRNRTSGDGIKVAEELLRFKSENRDPRYSFDVMTQDALILGKAPIAQFIIATFSLCLNPESTLNRAIFNKFLLGGHFDQPLSDEELEFMQNIRLLAPMEAFDKVVMRYNLDRTSEHIAYLQAIHEQLIAYCNSKIGDIPLFLKWWEESGSKKALTVEQSETAIEITTIHKSKGLERKVVLIPYCDWSLKPKSSGFINNILWAQPEGSLNELGNFPVKFSDKLKQSQFSNDYFRESVYSHIDNINLLYVAITRAAEVLEIFVPSNKNNINSLIIDSLSFDASGAVTLADMRGEVVESEDSVRYSFSKLEPAKYSNKSQSSSDIHIMSHYPTTMTSLQLKLSMQRYLEAEQGNISPRHIGILMHQAFEGAITAADIFKQIDTMHLNALISTEEHNRLTLKMEQALAREPISEWFEDKWDEVRNENDIILPKSSSIRRPDRVMIAGSRAVVVDYKFGEIEATKHERQVRYYMSLLKQMGYSQVEGYVWYVNSDKVERL